MPEPLIAVDVGNARIKLGLFRGRAAATLPEPAATFSLAGRDADFAPLATWLDASEVAGGAAWFLGSVNQSSAARLLDWLRSERPHDRQTLLTAAQLPLEVNLPRPDLVGVDRLLDALAAKRALSGRDSPRIVVDVGTAVTVDLLSPAGAFMGGAILPGMAMSARALHECTEQLPLVDVSQLAAFPPALGDSTLAAICAGLAWGLLGGVRQLIEQLAGQYPPQVIVTGGGGRSLAELLPGSPQYVPHLTLAGIALAAEALGA